MNTTNVKKMKLDFAKKRPVITFLLINFAWTWLFWFVAIPFSDRNDLLVVSLVIIGGYGPALAGIATIGLRSGMRIDLSFKKVVTLVLSAGLIFGVIALRYRAGNIPNFNMLAEDLTLNISIVAAALFASLLGGWMISSAVSPNKEIRQRMASILPWRASTGWTILGIIFYPMLILIAWGLAAVLGMGVEYPPLWDKPVLDVLPLYTLIFALTFLAQGGNEEPGWRGLMQPELQKRFNPLIAALIVAVFWSLWHLPLYLNGFYPGPLVSGMISGFIFRILLSIFLAWFYNRSDGNLFAIMFLHASFNVMVNFLPTSDAGLTLLWLLLAIVLVVTGKMYRKTAVGKNQRS